MAILTWLTDYVFLFAKAQIDVNFGIAIRFLRFWLFLLGDSIPTLSLFFILLFSIHSLPKVISVFFF
jgi:hypothetical protein